MPDLDIVERGLRKHWRKPYKQMKGRQPPEAVADAVIKALAATLRDDGGMPAFEEVAAVALPVSSGSGSSRSFAEATRAIEMQFHQRRPVKLLAQAAQRHMAKVKRGRAIPGRASLADEYCRSLLDHHLFSKVNGAGQEDGQGGRECEAEAKAAMEPQLRAVVRQLLADPTARKLRAPKSPHRRRSTAELLDEPLVRERP